MLIKSRVSALEAKIKPVEQSYVLAEHEDGSQEEVTVHEYYERRHELHFIRFTHGTDPKFRDVKLMIRVWDEAAREKEGNT